MLDLLVRGGAVVDGSGRPRQTADVGIRDGVVATYGRVTEPAKRVVDADGLVVAPGFVDVHTHYDAQVFWDPSLTPSSLYGVTTVIAGNCGFSVAPLADSGRNYIMKMLSRVEGMPLQSLAEGAKWDWSSTGDYLGLVEARSALNIGFLAGHSALRRVVMGEDANQRQASDDELAQLQRLLRRSLSEGALGFSSSLGF